VARGKRDVSKGRVKTCRQDAGVPDDLRVRPIMGGCGDALFVIGEAGEDFSGVVWVAAAIPELEGAVGEGDAGEAICRPEGRRYMC
jgi:hypothetical protein